jgi:thioredoxin-dependent peroxiredoxin
MRNNTGSCDQQNDTLAAAAAAIRARGFEVVAVSRDTEGSHQKYAVKKKIDYSLVSDPDDKFAHAVDAVVKKFMYGKTY